VVSDMIANHNLVILCVSETCDKFECSAIFVCLMELSLSKHVVKLGNIRYSKNNDLTG
jgi:hypothetical protein